MDPVTAGMVAGVGVGALDFLGGLWQGHQNRELQRETNQQNLMQTMVQWHRDDTAVQRRVKDLQAAGLNPALAAGSAASSGSPLAMSPPKMSGLDRAGESILKGLSVSQLNSQIAKTKAETNYVNQQTANANEELKYKKQTNTKLGIENQYLEDQIKMDLAYKLAQKKGTDEATELKKIEQKIKNYDYKFHKDNFQAYNRPPGKEDPVDRIIRYLAALRSGAVPDVVEDVKSGWKWLRDVARPTDANGNKKPVPLERYPLSRNSFEGYLPKKPNGNSGGSW